VAAATFLALAGTLLMGACQASDTTDPTASPSASPSGVPSKPPSSVPSSAPASAPPTYPTTPPTALPFSEAYRGTWGGAVGNSRSHVQGIVQVSLYPAIGSGLANYTYSNGNRCYVKLTLQRNDPHDVIMTETSEFASPTNKCDGHGYEVLSLSGNTLHFELRTTPTSSAVLTGALSKTNDYHAPGH
jgi:hypothetical protein